MALAAAPLDQSFRASPSRVVSRQDAEASSETSSVHSADPSDRRDAEILAMSTRSEEYRLMFRLPPDEVLVQDFNCALQENILLQGHMYLFLHHICFYSNIFGFETKKTISFLEVSCVRKAKTAGIFPNAIEILAGGKKHFFGSFLSRDEAYRLIVEGWSQHNNDAKAIFDQQDMKSDVSSSNSSLAIVEFAQGSTQPPSDSLTSDGNMNANILNECLPSSIGENGIIVPSRLVEVKENGEEKAEYLSTGNLSWPVEDVDVPKVPEYFTLVAEAKFLKTFLLYSSPIMLLSFLRTSIRDAETKSFSTPSGTRMNSWDILVIYHSYIQSKYILVQSLVVVRRSKSFVSIGTAI